MSLTLYFLRHGETTYSQTGGYCGTLDPDLTDEGHRMAQAFAATYQEIAWTAIYVSPMKRTIATAKPLCEAVGMEMQLRDGLKELHYGEWEGKTPEYVKATHLDDYIKWLTEPAWNPPTGGETAVEVASRATPTISKIESEHSEGNVLVVSHKGTIRILLCSLLGIDLGRYRDRIDMPAASVSVVKFDTHGPLLQRLGDRAYLPDDLRERSGT
ncbi:histidine phosphatase family protein [Tumidithrix helvetica PCC 7403]|uniref:histidine phosphatase family protein n=1 Tax=Tumidithrix helvetica TaxID=3457545 RepID=UPI003CA18947